MAKRILILTNPEDFHAFAVREALREKEAEVTLWHTPDFPSQSGETVLFEGGARTIVVEGPELALHSPHFDTVWRRRPSYSIDWSKIHPADRKFVDVECNVFRRALFSVIGEQAFWVNTLESAVRAGHKVLQHDAASVIGFKAPDTLYSNDPQQIRAFIRRHGGTIVYKPLRGLPWQDERAVWMPFTSLLREEQLVADDLLRSAPGIYQELIPKAYELRVTAMGHCLLAAKILSQDREAAKLDWRRAPDEIKIEPFELRDDIARRCHDLMERLGLVFGCFDFIVTPSGEAVFLEVNEMGQFLFLEPSTGLPLLDRFSEFLLSGRADYAGQHGKTEIRYADVIDRAQAEMERAGAIHCAAPESYSSEEARTAATVEEPPQAVSLPGASNGRSRTAGARAAPPG